MKTSISKMVGVCFYQLRKIQQFQQLVGHSITLQLVSVFILSWLDYCNSLLACLHSLATATCHECCHMSYEFVNLRPHDTGIKSPALAFCQTQNIVQTMFLCTMYTSVELINICHQLCHQSPHM